MFFCNVKHEIFINGYIGEMFDFFGDGNSFTLKDINNSLASMPADVTEIEVHINSGGGLVSEGFAIHDKLVSTGIPVTTIVEGMCGSIATIIAQAGKSGSRKMFQNSEYFIHNPLWIPLSPDAHNADDLQKLTEELRKSEEKIIDFYVKTTGTDRNVLAEKMKVETTLSASEAKDLGFIDEIISTDVVAMVKYKIAAAVNVQKQKPNTMKDEIVAAIAAGFKKLDTLFAANKKQKFVNVMTVEGVEIYYDGEIAEGVAVFTDEAMTIPAPDGTYTIDTTVYTVVGGVVTGVAELTAQKTELEIANEKIAALTAELEAIKAEVVTAKAEKEELAAANKAIEAEFVALKSQIETGLGQSFIANVGKPTPQPKPTWQEQLIAFRKEREAKNKK